MSPTKSRRNQGQRTFRRRVTQTLKSMTSGRRLRVRPNPPAVVAAPYNRIVLTTTSTATNDGTTCFKISDLILLFGRQTGLKSPALALRIQSLRAWDITGFPINIACDVLADGTQCGSFSDALCTLEDFPGKNVFAAVGYRWPAAQRQQVKTAAEAATVIARLTQKKSSIVLMYIEILWSPGSLSLPANSNAVFDYVDPLAALVVPDSFKTFEIVD